MTWHLWLGFVAASALMGVIPGPGVVSIVGYALGAGRRVALAAVAGMAVGNAVAMSLSLAGVGTVLAVSTTAFLVLKWAGALSLIALGLLTLARTRETTRESSPTRRLTPRAAFLGTVAVGTFHPKTIVFFVAFAPQFISPSAAYAGQAAILIATFCCVVGATDTAYALAATHASAWLRRPDTARWAERVGGGVLVAAGIATAATRA